MRQFRAIVSGRVQGVGFRAETVSVARQLGLSGHARNLPDGRVEVIATGADEPLARLLSFLHHGPPLAQVELVNVDWSDATPLEDRFVVRY